MAQIDKTITVALEISMPVRYEVRGSECHVSADMRKALKFTKKLAKMCARYGYTMTREE